MDISPVLFPLLQEVEGDGLGDGERMRATELSYAPKNRRVICRPGQEASKMLAEPKSFEAVVISKCCG